MGQPRMVRLLVALACSASAASGCATGKSASVGGTSSSNEVLEFYPLFAGWGWAFEIERDEGKVLALYSVVERTADLATVKNGDDRLVYAVLPDGIARREAGATGDFIVRSPLRRGATWPVKQGEAKVTDTGRTVDLPSGTFRDCAVVEEVRRDPNRVTRTTYCRGTGPVDIEMRVFDPFKMAYQTVAHARLLGVTRPEAAP
jgi:hypothetical protein